MDTNNFGAMQATCAAWGLAMHFKPLSYADGRRSR